MASYVLKIISMTLGIFFIFIGTLKLTPSVNKELHKEMRKMYIRNAKVFPLVTWTKWKPNSHMYRKVIGGSEVVCGAILAFIPGPLKEAANVLMILIASLDIYSHYALDEGLDKMSLSVVFFLLLMCRLIIHLQMKAREDEEAAQRAQAYEREQAPPTCQGHTHNVHPNAGAGFSAVDKKNQ
ncbi:novel acetylcholine receptor chaperone-like [Saccostrea echinata]|uniref:novel acetylcholine receptor chaperone-like n=1 Tax=Saccostrea echinata TaxID=191078 RepID=UPI002A83FBE6|nr:novel acetylcholine receptor chaperone-like [Saccostrea echinata]